MLVYDWLRSLCCRHDDLPTFEDDRLSLTCQKCGRQTVGWEIGTHRIGSVSTPDGTKVLSIDPQW